MKTRAVWIALALAAPLAQAQVAAPSSLPGQTSSVPILQAPSMVIPMPVYKPPWMQLPVPSGYLNYSIGNVHAWMPVGIRP